MLKIFKVTAILEGISYLVLFANMLIIKTNNPELYHTLLRPLGMTHGVLFIGYIILAFLLKKSQIALGKEINISCAIWSICMLISFNILNFKSISVASEAIDIIYKLKVSNILAEIFRITTIFIVINSICFFVSYFSINYLNII